MTEKEILKLLRANGWIITEGSNHHIAKHPNMNVRVPIPRHKGDIPLGTANKILKDTGLK
jgi:predicted RNA binding protein YcfA (HicA-like mRNA interferase family)